MKIIQNILTKNRCYTAGRKITPQGLMLHSVGCPQPKASAFINNWNSSSASVCVHGIIDGNTGDVYQTLPWNHRAWHCGSGSKGSGNNTHIGVEMCEPACIKYTGGSSFTCSDKATAIEVAKRTYNVAVELFAYLCKEYGLNPLADGVIISHSEGHKRGISSNHGDPEHLWRGLGLSYTMDGFRKDVKAAMSGVSAPSAPSVSTSTTSSKKNSIPSKVPFTVRVLVSDLNYRSEPSMKGTVKGQTGKGSFTITQVSGGWGKLKSGVGWIYLENPEYCTIVTSSAAPAPSTTTSKDYKVQVTTGALNVRAGAGTNYKVNTVIRDKGIYTIVETKSNWGKLKSGAGWICLDYTKKV